MSDYNSYLTVYSMTIMTLTIILLMMIFYNFNKKQEYELLPEVLAISAIYIYMV